MIKTFGCKHTAELFRTGRAGKFPSTIFKTALKRLDTLDAACRLDDLRLVRGWRFEPLKGKLKGRCNIRINDQWRVVFRFEDGDAWDVEITDYH